MTNRNIEKKMLTSWIIGKNSYTLIISKEFAIESGMDNADQVIVEQINKGIIVKKIDIPSKAR